MGECVTTIVSTQWAFILALCICEWRVISKHRFTVNIPTPEQLLKCVYVHAGA